MGRFKDIAIDMMNKAREEMDKESKMTPYGRIRNKRGRPKKSFLKSLQPSVSNVESLWKKVVKARAGWKSELGGAGGYLHPHHILGKPNYRLRFELDNGICINGGQHMAAHNPFTAEEMKQRCLKVRGVSEEKLKLLGRITGGADLFLIKAYLQVELEKYGDKPVRQEL